MDIKKLPQAWKHESELALVRDYFYPEHKEPDPFAPAASDKRLDAIDLIALYLLRNPGTPHAMAATANLTEASLHNEQADRDSHISDNAMRSIYAMAFVKFVNGFVDRDVAKANTASLALGAEPIEVDDDYDSDILRSIDDESGEMKAKVKGGGESSMYAYAAKIGMPEDFVDLRHNIVHGDIPPLETLRGYNKQALGWLWEKWWTRNATGDPTRAKSEMEEQAQVADAARRRSIEAWQQYDAAKSSADAT